MDAASERYVAAVAGALTGALGSTLVGVYLHGSAVLGGFDLRRSDVDILGVCAAPMPSEVKDRAARALGQEALPCPAQGLELSIVTRDAARHVTRRPRFELHLTTAPGDSKVIDGRGHPGDPDLVLHFAVCRVAGRLIGPGRPVGEVFAPVPPAILLEQLAAELEWAPRQATAEYAVLNACRAWRYAADGAIVSKVDGGRWALSRVHGAERDLVAAALARQTSASDAGLDAGAVEEFVRGVLARFPTDCGGIAPGDPAEQTH